MIAFVYVYVLGIVAAPLSSSLKSRGGGQLPECDIVHLLTVSKFDQEIPDRLIPQFAFNYYSFVTPSLLC